MPSPPSLTMTFWHFPSSVMPAFHTAKVSSFLSAYGPMPSGPPTWFRMIVVCGKARARSASSISCGWYSQASKVRFSGASRANPARQVASAIWPFVAFVRPRENISLGSQTTEWRMPRKRPSPAVISASSTRATPSPRRRSACPTIPARQPALAVLSAFAHRRRAVDEFDFAHRLHLRRPIGAVHRAAFDKNALRDVVTATGVGEQLVEQVPVPVAVPQMMVRIDDLERRLQDFLFALRPPRRVAVTRSG